MFSPSPQWWKSREQYGTKCLSTGGEVFDSLPVGCFMTGEILLFGMKDGSDECEGDAVGQETGVVSR